MILAAAGTSDLTAGADLRTTAALLSTLTGSPVDLGFAATSCPHITDVQQAPDVRKAVAKARASAGRHSARRVVVASYLLADGLFQERLRACGADLVSGPLGTHPGLAQLIANRFRKAMRPAPLATSCRIPRRLIFDHLRAILKPCPVAKSNRVGSSTQSRRCCVCHSAHRNSSTESSPEG